MKKFLAIFLSLVMTSIAPIAHADGAAAESHSHCACGKADCAENHEQSGGAVWQKWDGNTDVGTVADGSGTTAVYLYLADDVTITDTLSITNTAVYLCLNGNTLTINKDGYSAIAVGENQKFVLCDCIGTGKITGANVSAGGKSDRFAAVNCRPGSSFVMYGGSIAGNKAQSSNGGGVFVKGGTFTMYGGSINNNTVAGGSGGAISVEGGQIYIYGGEMNENSAINGGAMHLKNNTSGEITKLKMNKNSAIGKNSMGGALFAETTVNIKKISDIEMSGNSAVSGGGAYFKWGADNCYANMYNLNIHDNNATGNGGGICFDGNNCSNPVYSVHDSRICNNTATGDGGGVYVRRGAAINLYGGTLNNNTCSGNGGAIHMASGTMLNLAKNDGKVSIQENRANNGGGIFFTAYTYIGNNECIIENNTAQSAGGGMYINSRSNYWMIITKTSVTNNKAQIGGGIYLDKDNTGKGLEIGKGTSVIGNTSSADSSASNLYIANIKGFQLLNSVNGSERIGVSVGTAPTVSKPVEAVYSNDDTRHTQSDKSSLIIPDNSDYKVIYKENRHWIVQKNPLKITNGEISVTGLDVPAVLIVASYNGNTILDVKKFEIEKDAAMTIDDTQLKITNATKVSAFLWDNSDGKWSTNMLPLCERADG